MKKLIVILLVIFSKNVIAQPFAEIGANNQGFKFGAGYIDQTTGIGLALHHNFPIKSSEIPNASTASITYKYFFADQWHVTALSGITFNTYSAAGKYLGYTNNTKASGGLEIGKDFDGTAGMGGTLFVTGSYSGRTYIGAGMKILINKN